MGTTVDEAERQLILKTLLSTHNNKTRAAEILGITAKTLQNAAEGYSRAPLPQPMRRLNLRRDRCARCLPRSKPMRLRTKLVLTATGLTFAIVLVLSVLFLGQLLRQRIEQTSAANDVLAREVRLATEQAVETGLSTCLRRLHHSMEAPDQTEDGTFHTAVMKP